MKVLIADDHPVVRQGIKQILTEKPDIMVVGEAVDGPDVLEKCRASDWDAVVLDLSMPGGELDLLKALKRERPTLPVLVLSVKTVSTYRSRILQKVERTTNAELVAYAVRHHLAE